jgi:hypothetical protein
MENDVYDQKDFDHWRAQLLVRFVADVTTRAWEGWSDKDCATVYRAVATEALLLIQAVARRDPLANLRQRAEDLKHRLSVAEGTDRDMSTRWGHRRAEGAFPAAVDALRNGLDITYADTKWIRGVQGMAAYAANLALSAGVPEVDIAEAYLAMRLKAFRRKAEKKHIAAAATCWIAGERDVARRLLKEGRVR